MASGGGSITKTLVWILMGMLILGLGGFGVTNLSGSVRSIGTVGEQEISIDKYARALQEEMRAFEAQTGQSMTFQKAREFGIDQAVLARLIAATALDHETTRIGLSMGDANLREQIVDIGAFQGANGSFDREAYKFALEQAGLTETDFERDLRLETARTLLQSAVMQGASLPDTYADTIIGFAAERRDFVWATLEAADLDAPLPTPSTEQLRSYYEANEDQFTTPPSKRITYALLTPEMLIDSVELPEEDLRREYKAREDTYIRPERRLVERLAFPDTEAARAALDAIKAGESTFESIVEERGISLSDIDLGDVTRGDLGDAAEAVFNGEAGSVVGPAQTNLGPALFRINGVLEAQETSFEDARPELREALAADRARRMIETRMEEVDNLLAGGATLEELRSETGMEVGEIVWNETVDSGIAAYAAFDEAAAEITAEDYPEVKMLDDGGIFALRLDENLPASVQPFDTVRDAAAEGWRNRESIARLKAQAEALLPDLASGAGAAELGVTLVEETGITRNRFIQNTPEDMVSTVFEMQTGKARLVTGQDRVAIVRLDAVRGPDETSQQVKQMRARLNQQAGDALAQDLYAAFADAIRARAGLTLNQEAINAVHNNFQ
ncbi:MAG: SurA N-terminal domain-containing protein [Sediminimonas sp.]|uniref:peptidyl-prolyl cis-trans isomerase n=1 Tax=Sediminimonas sp. TaxID=2823379 RepID=UPI00286FC13A|nr:peptidyl-prolyl cis-trans isomerase [Sediminimonas sp.]MDR9484483.1 SurA N-terminal domain-containing protein [Sediminimonas sp.]